MIVAIDGPAGSGKSTVARSVSQQTGFFYLNSGHFYRAVTWLALRSGVQEADERTIVEAARRSGITVEKGRLHIDGVDRETELRSEAVEAWVARHSGFASVREVVNEKLVEIAKGMDVVVEGRDMTTVVFPHADVKIFLDADIDTRARRRCGQFQAESTLEEVRKQIRQRDEYDKTKRHGSLRISPDALYLDTSDLTLDQVCDKVINTVRKMRNHQELQGSHGR